MTGQTPVWKDTFKTVAEALGVHERTAKRMERDGEIRSVRFGSEKKPIVRLEPPQEYLARKGRYSGTESTTA